MCQCCSITKRCSALASEETVTVVAMVLVKGKPMRFSSPPRSCCVSSSLQRACFCDLWLYVPCLGAVVVAQLKKEAVK